MHPVHDRMIGPGESYQPGDVREVDPVRAAGREVGPLDASTLPIPIHRSLASTEHLKKRPLVELDRRRRVPQIRLLSRIEQLSPHPGTLRLMLNRLLALACKNRHLVTPTHDAPFSNHRVGAAPKCRYALLVEVVVLARYEMC